MATKVTPKKVVRTAKDMFQDTGLVLTGAAGATTIVEKVTAGMAPGKVRTAVRIAGPMAVGIGLALTPNKYAQMVGMGCVVAGAVSGVQQLTGKIRFNPMADGQDVALYEVTADGRLQRRAMQRHRHIQEEMHRRRQLQQAQDEPVGQAEEEAEFADYTLELEEVEFSDAI